MKRLILALMPALATVITLILCVGGFILSLPYAREIEVVLTGILAVILLTALGAFLYSMFSALFKQE